MIVYHGAVQEVKRPDISYSKKYLDFGKGFYVTTYQEQAKKWAIRKAMRKQSVPVVNIYELSNDLSEYNVLRFGEEDGRWLDFICACRKGEEIYQAYDIIIGNVADDDVFKTVDMYFRGIWDRQRTIRELRYFRKNNQIALVNQEVLDIVLKFKESYEVKL